jgi:hypothetical protein
VSKRCLIALRKITIIRRARVDFQIRKWIVKEFRGFGLIKNLDLIKS